MKTLLISAAFFGLLATIVPSILVFAGTINPGTHKAIMAIGMVVWFAAAPFCIRRKESP
jgi:hypothetical protein